MSLIAQDDTGAVANANAYINYAYYETYFTDRGISAALDYGQADVEPAIITVTDYMDQRWRFKGRRLTGQAQATEHPRAQLIDREGYYVNGIHPNIKKACAEYTFRLLVARDSGQELMPDPTIDPSGRAIVSKSTTVGPLVTAVTYEQGAALSHLIKPYPYADRLLRDLVVTGGGVIR